MNIIEALQALKEGKKITVDSEYFSKGNYIYYDEKYLKEHNSLPYGKKVKGLEHSGYSIFLSDYSTFQDDIYHIYEKPILDDVEKKYLENIIAPFKDKVVYIQKVNSIQKDKQNFESIQIIIDSEYYKYMYESISLPYFKKRTMYRGMKSNKNYKLEELGLFK